MSNRLASATSPYLQQHADNPVDWWEWSDEAFREAAERDLPVLLSVGYAACHWCHVMAHESFEDPATAALMNEHFVCIKVDREERPDVDAVYMKALIGLTGHGGWPMTVFCAPDGRPFYAGTYYPPEPRHPMPSFPQLLTALAGAWREQRTEVERSATAIGDRLAALSAPSPTAAGAAAPDRALLAAAVDRLVAQFDHAHAGFGGAPKFPPSMTVEFLLRHHAATGDGRSLGMAQDTWQAMARGGIYDQLGGGFARYSVDAAWQVPHFEKMLYDNALLARVYLHAWRSTGDPLARRVAEETLDFLLAELGTAEGGFASSLDADSDDGSGRPVEGAYYLWTRPQLLACLGESDGAWAADLLGVTDRFAPELPGATLQLRRDPDDEQRWGRIRAALRRHRDARPRPGRDDKVVTAWNGFAIAALAEGAVLLDRPDLLAAATRAAELLQQVHLVDGRLRRSSRDGIAGAPSAVLEDYAALADGLLALLAAGGQERWWRWTVELLDEALDRFGDGVAGYYDAAADAGLLYRPRDLDDGATPASTALLAGALLSAAAIGGSQRYRQAAEEALITLAPIAREAPRSAGWALAVAEALQDGPREVAVIGSPGPARSALLRAAMSGTAPGAAIVVGGGDSEVPLLTGRPAAAEPIGYVCRQFVCQAPTADPAALTALLTPAAP